MFDYSLDFKNTDFRRHPERYRIGKGEQGVLRVGPHKGEILPHRRFPGNSVAARFVTNFAPTVAHDEEMPTCLSRTQTLGRSWTCARWVRPWRRRRRGRW